MSENKQSRQKKPEDMTDRELMIELLRQQKANATWQRISSLSLIVLIVAVVIGFFMIIPRINEVTHQLQRTIVEVEPLIEKATTAIDKFDVDALSEAVNNLSKITSSLASLFKF